MSKEMKGTHHTHVLRFALIMNRFIRDLMSRSFASLMKEHYIHLVAFDSLTKDANFWTLKPLCCIFCKQTWNSARFWRDWLVDVHGASWSSAIALSPIFKVLIASSLSQRHVPAWYLKSQIIATCSFKHTLNVEAEDWLCLTSHWTGCVSTLHCSHLVDCNWYVNQIHWLINYNQPYQLQ